MSAYIVAGATGRVGSAVAKHLLERGENVTVITRDADRGTSWAARGAGVAVGSLGDTAFLRSVLAGAHGFFTLLPEPFDAADFHTERRRVADAIAASVSESRVPRVVMVSSVGAHRAEGVGPVRGLHHLENALRATDTRFTAVRGCMFQDYIASAIQPARLAGIYPNLLPSRALMVPMVATRDVGAIAGRELASTPDQNDVVDVIGPMYTPAQIAAILGDAIGRPLAIVDIPVAGHVAALTQAGLPLSFAEAVAELQAAVAAGIMVPVGDRLETATTSLETTLAEIVASMPELQSA